MARRLDDLNDGLIADLYAQGRTLAEIGAEFGVSLQTVSNRLEAAGAPRRPTGRSRRGERHPNAKLTAAQVREIVRRSRQGAQHRALAKEYGVSESHVSNILAGRWRVGDFPATTPECEPHEPRPEGYIAWSEWADMMTETHACRQCRGCGLWMIWEPKENADGC